MAFTWISIYKVSQPERLVSMTVQQETFYDKRNQFFWRWWGVISLYARNTRCDVNHTGGVLVIKYLFSTLDKFGFNKLKVADTIYYLRIINLTLELRIIYVR